MILTFLMYLGGFYVFSIIIGALTQLLIRAYDGAKTFGRMFKW
jgi:hypothetical protein